MIDGIVAALVPSSMRYSAQVNGAAIECKFSPLVIYAVAWNETIEGEVSTNAWDAATVISGDGGHGLCQLTSSYPENWQDPRSNAIYAINNFLQPAQDFWSAAPYQFTGDNLVRAMLAEYNAGRGNALAGHAAGNIDLYTTNKYAARGLDMYHKLIGLVTGAKSV
jgi:hypothetical protein